MTQPGSEGSRRTPLALILTGDDLGRHDAINHAVIRAHKEGVLTAASLMVAGRSADEAVRLAKENPTLAVGLHAVMVNGPSVLGHRALPHITDAYGRFPADEYGLGFRYFVSATARDELARELEAQFQRFAEYGLPMSHVDGHAHMHMHPSVLPLFLRLADRWGAPGFRLPRDALAISLSHDRSRFALKVLWSGYYRALRRWARRAVEQSALVHTDRVYGLYESGRMTETYVLHLLARIPPEVQSAEIHFHPSEQGLGEALGPNPGDLAALLSHRVRGALEAMGVQRVSYRDLARRQGAST